MGEGRGTGEMTRYRLQIEGNPGAYRFDFIPDHGLVQPLSLIGCEGRRPAAAGSPLSADPPCVHDEELCSNVKSVACLARAESQYGAAGLVPAVQAS